MKKIVHISLAILVLIASLLYAKYLLTQTNASSYDQQLYVYNWGEYIDPEVIDDFEELYHIDVVYDTYDSNESLYTKLKNNSTRYDVVFPSEYMVDKMNQEQMLIPIDVSKLSNYSNINPDLLNPHLKDVSIPYFWGTVGIVYNKTLTDLDFDSWNDLWDSSLKGQIIIPDSAREVMGMSLDSLNLSVNSTNLNELKWAQDKLFTLQPNIKAIIGDEMLQVMPNDEAAVAITWSGSAKYMQEKNENLVYTIPKEGTNIWIDSAVIPKNCGNLDGAYQFIDYLLSNDISLKNSEYVGYSTPNINVEAIFKEEADYNPIYYPEIDSDRFEFYQNLSPEMTMVYNDLFLEFKMF